MGAHLGSFEVMRAIGRRQPGLAVAMVMYEENARKINAMLAAINPEAVQDIIALGHIDSMLRVQDRLDEGMVLGMLADRTLGDDTTYAFPSSALTPTFPVGPFRMAALLRRPVVFMTGLYLGGNRYAIHFDPLADFCDVARRQRDAAIAGRHRALTPPAWITTAARRPTTGSTSSISGARRMPAKT